MKIKHFILYLVIVIISIVMTSCTSTYHSTRPNYNHGSTLIIRGDNERSHDNDNYRYKNNKKFKKDKKNRDRD